MEMTMITYTTEKIKDVIVELAQLTLLHYAESAPYDDIPLKVDWERYKRLEQFDILRLYTMRKSGKLIGYCAFTVGESIEYSDSLQASLSNIFLHPDHRGGGHKFITYCDEQLKSLGVQVVYHHVKAKNDYGVLLKRLGYDIMNIEYAKRLDK